MRDGKARLKGFPDIAAQTVAAGQPQPMPAFEFGNRCFQEVAAEFADILEQRAVKAHDIAPESLCRKLLSEHHRAARVQHAAWRDDAADAVADRQAIVQPVFDSGAGQSGEPAAPVQDAAVTDAGGLGQAGRAGGIDQQRAIVDGDAAPLGRRQRVSIHPIQHCADTGFTAVNPDSRRPVQIRQRRFQNIRKIIREDDMVGVRDVDAMRQRQPDQFGIDQRYHAADFGDAEPRGDIVRPARHYQANGIAGLNSCRQRPARIAVDPLRQRPVIEGFSFRDQRGTVRLPLGPILDDIGEQASGIGLDARGQLDGFQPAFGRRRFSAQLRAICRLLDDIRVHGQTTCRSRINTLIPAPSIAGRA